MNIFDKRVIGMGGCGLLIVTLSACGAGNENQPVAQTQTAVAIQQQQIELTRAALDIQLTQAALIPTPMGAVQPSLTQAFGSDPDSTSATPFETATEFAHSFEGIPAQEIDNLVLTQSDIEPFLPCPSENIWTYSSVGAFVDENQLTALNTQSFGLEQVFIWDFRESHEEIREDVHWITRGAALMEWVLRFDSAISADNWMQRWRNRMPLPGDFADLTELSREELSSASIGEDTLAYKYEDETEFYTLAFRRANIIVMLLASPRQPFSIEGDLLRCSLNSSVDLLLSLAQIVDSRFLSAE